MIRGRGRRPWKLERTRSILGHKLRAFVVLRVVVPLVELDGEAAVEGILRQVRPGGLGMARDDAP